MTNKLRVRIVHDSSPEDPREWDDMCMIQQIAPRATYVEKVCDLIAVTEGFKAAMEMLEAATPVDTTYDEPHDRRVYYDMHCDDALRDRWLEAVKGELIVEKFNTQYENYIAYTTPDMCKVIGTPWERAAECMKDSIDTFKQWAKGDVYGYVIEYWSEACACEDCGAGEWIETDSCWGFYGSDPFENGMSDHVPEELHDMLRNAEVEYKYQSD